MVQLRKAFMGDCGFTQLVNLLKAARSAVAISAYTQLLYRLYTVAAPSAANTALGLGLADEEVVAAVLVSLRLLNQP